MDYISINILVVILYTFAKVIIEGKWVKCTWVLFVLHFKYAYESTINSIKSLIKKIQEQNLKNVKLL